MNEQHTTDEQAGGYMDFQRGQMIPRHYSVTMYNKCNYLGLHCLQRLLHAFLMTDSICHSSLPRTVLEKVTLTTIQFRIHPRTKVDPIFQCVYISTPLKSCTYKSSATCFIYGESR